MKTTVKTALFAIALATVTFACDNAAKNDNVDGAVDSTAVSNPTMDEAMSTSGDTATVVRTDSTAGQEIKQETGNAVDATTGAAKDAGNATKDAAHDATH